METILLAVMIKMLQKRRLITRGVVLLAGPVAICPHQSTRKGLDLDQKRGPRIEGTTRSPRSTGRARGLQGTTKRATRGKVTQDREAIHRTNRGKPGIGKDQNRPVTIATTKMTVTSIDTMTSMKKTENTKTTGKANTETIEIGTTDMTSTTIKRIGIPRSTTETISTGIETKNIKTKTINTGIEKTNTKKEKKNIRRESTKSPNTERKKGRKAGRKIGGEGARRG